MKVLAFDTSSRFLSIACLDDSNVISEFHEDVGVRHSEILVPTIKGMLEGVGWKISEIDLICTGLGPGSFTGLRIAVATVKALAAVTPGKVIGIPTMDAIAMNAPEEKGIIAPFIDARKNKVYTCIYECSAKGLERKTDHLLVAVEEFISGLTEEVFFFGDAVTIYREKLDKYPYVVYDENMDWYPRASEIGRMGIKKFAMGADDPELIEPLYMHPQECNIIDKNR